MADLAVRLTGAFAATFFVSFAAVDDGATVDFVDPPFFGTPFVDALGFLATLRRLFDVADVPRATDEPPLETRDGGDLRAVVIGKVEIHRTLRTSSSIRRRSPRAGVDSGKARMASEVQMSLASVDTDF